MITATTSIYGAAVFAPERSSAATYGVPRRDPAPAPPAAATEPVPVGDDAAAAQQRYFEEMVNSAADLLIQTQMAQIRAREDGPLV